MRFPHFDAGSYRFPLRAMQNFQPKKWCMVVVLTPASYDRLYTATRPRAVLGHEREGEASQTDRPTHPAIYLTSCL